MFCSHCGYIINRDSKFRTNCGAKTISKDIRDKNYNKSENILLIFEKMNWSQHQCNTGVWLNTKWTIYNDKTIIKEVKYDKCFFTNTDETTHISNTTLNDDEFYKLKTLADDIIPQLAMHDGNDGTGWKITLFDETGKTLHTASGYVYGIKTFDTIRDILK